MAAGIHDYDWPTSVHTMITAFALNDTLEADVTLKFNLARLSPRMLTMLRNNFVRGYKLHEGYGKLNSMTNILCNQFKVPRLPLINKHHGFFYQEDIDFQKWLVGMGVIMEIPITLNSEIQHPVHKYDAEMHYLSEPDTDPIPANLMCKAVRKKYKHTLLPKTHDVRQQVIKVIEQQKIIVIRSEYKLGDID